jgi:hypothetical protein
LATFGCPTLKRVLTVYGACAVTFMVLMYALERRGPQFVLAFAGGCALSSSYGFMAGTWPFGIVEAIWSVVAVRRYVDLRRREPEPPERPTPRVQPPLSDDRS